MTRLRTTSPSVLAAMAAVLTAAVAAVAFVIVMSQSDYRRTGTNSLVVPTHAEIPRGKSLCQDDEYIPAGSRWVAPWAGGPNGADGGLVDVRITVGGELLATGRSPERYPTGITRFRLDRTIERDVKGATVCFRNRDSLGRQLFLYGEYAPVGTSGARAPAFYQGQPAVMRLDWYGERRKTWWHAADVIARRFHLVKAGVVGAPAMWLALATILLVSAFALWRVVAEARRSV